VNNNYSHSGIQSKEYGVYSLVNGSGCSSVEGTANYGGWFHASKAMVNFGGFFEALCTCTSSVGYGIFAVADPDCGYAGYFDGDVAYTGDVSHVSDGRFKINRIPVTNAMSTIQQLNPISFEFNPNSPISLPGGIQYGLVAQEVNEILPDIVSYQTHPAKYDSLGNLVHDTVIYMGINYISLIPILIQGEKELKSENDSLKAVIASYEDRFQAIESTLASCCTQNKSASVDVTIQNRPLTIPSNGNSLGQNYPNPFRTVTTFTYTIANNGFVEFVIDDSYGKEVARLVNENKTAGTYGMEWEPQLAAGIYFYSLKVNGEVLVKKAVKIE
jgi:hypothetical protein